MRVVQIAIPDRDLEPVGARPTCLATFERFVEVLVVAFAAERSPAGLLQNLFQAQSYKCLLAGL
jgi:hypothetical protein